MDFVVDTYSADNFLMFRGFLRDHFVIKGYYTHLIELARLWSSK